jgi:hypothetical protein
LLPPFFQPSRHSTFKRGFHRDSMWEKHGVELLAFDHPLCMVLVAQSQAL